MKASKKLITASVALVASLAVSVGSTFAWFTTSDSVTVTPIEAEVKTGSGTLYVRQVNVDGTPIADPNGTAGEWGVTLKPVISKDIRLDALTDRGTYSGDGVWDDQTKHGLSLTDKEGKPAEEAEIESYIELHLQFKYQLETAKQTEGVILHLGGASKVTSTKNQNITQRITPWTGVNSMYGLTGTDAIEAHAQNAVRAAFIPVRTYATNTSSDDVIFADSLGIWAPNEVDKLGTQGQAAGANTANRGQGYWMGNLAHEYEYFAGTPFADLLYKCQRTPGSGTADTLAYTSPYTKGVMEGGTTATDTVVTMNSTTSALVSVKDTAETNKSDYVYGQVTVRIWLEGTDGDCFNNIFGDTISASLVFEIFEVA